MSDTRSLHWRCERRRLSVLVVCLTQRKDRIHALSSRFVGKWYLVRFVSPVCPPLHTSLPYTPHLHPLRHTHSIMEKAVTSPHLAPPEARA